MKRIIGISLALLLVVFCVGPAWAKAPIPKKHMENFYVHDFANMLDSDHVRNIMAVGAAIGKASGAEVIVVTIDSLENYPIEEYANELFRSWGIGDKQKNNGVLLLINKENIILGKSGRVRIEVGYGLEGAIPDGKAGRILDEYVLPSWDEGKYSEGIFQGYMALAQIVAEEYQLEIDQDKALAQLNDYKVKESSPDLGNIPLEIILFIIVAIVIALLNNRGGGGRGRGRRTFGYPSSRGPFWGGPFSGGSFGGRNSLGGGRGGFGGFGGGSSGGGGASR